MIGRQIVRAWQVTAPAFGVLVEIVALLAGAGLVAYGAWQAWAPGGPIAAGALVIAGVLLRARGAGA